MWQIIAICLLVLTQEINSRITGSELIPNNIAPAVGTIQVKRGADASAKTIQLYLDECDSGYKLQEEKSVIFSSPFFGSTSPPVVSCDWTFVGDTTCTPEIVCPDLDLTTSEGCSDEYLEISDGVGGVEKFCGKVPFTNGVRASKSQLDLYVKFVSKGAVSSRKGFQCEARCSAGQPRPLKSSEVEKKEEFRCVCGIDNKDDRIVGGEDAKMNEFPWQVAIVTAGTRSPTCGGSKPCTAPPIATSLIGFFKLC